MSSNACRFGRALVMVCLAIFTGAALIATQGCTIVITTGQGTGTTGTTGTGPTSPTTTTTTTTVNPTSPTTTTTTTTTNTARPPEVSLLVATATEVAGCAVESTNVSATIDVTLYRYVAQTTSRTKACTECHRSQPSGSAPSSHNDGRMTEASTGAAQPVAVATGKATLAGTEIKDYPPGYANHGYRFLMSDIETSKRPAKGDKVYVVGQGAGGQAASATRQLE